METTSMTAPTQTLSAEAASSSVLTVQSIEDALDIQRHIYK